MVKESPLVKSNALNKENSAVNMRSSNLELFRIITMFLIVAHHYVVNSELFFEGYPVFDNLLSKKSLFILIFGAWGKTGINCFVLITGYFMCKSNITAKKFVKLLFEVMFYRIVIYTAFLVSGYEPFSLKEFIKMLIPIINVGNDFIGAFIIFYLFIPFLNVFLKAANEIQHIKLLAILGFTYIFFGTMPFFTVTMNYVSWFCVLYFIASYIRLYPKKIFSNTKFWGYATLVVFIVSVVSVVACSFTLERFNLFNVHYFVSDSNSLLAVLLGLSSFMFFKNLNIKNSKFINTVSASTFGVLLIHANSNTMRRFLWVDLLDNFGAYNKSYTVLHAVICVLAVYIVCTVIDVLMSKFIEKPVFVLFDKCFEKVSEKYKIFENKIIAKLESWK